MKKITMETCENMPTRQSMRKSSDYDSWNDCYSRKQYKTYVHRFIEKHVGENYNEVYSLFIKKLKEKHISEMDMIFMKEDFLYNFNGRYCHDFSIDDNGDIVKIKRKTRSKDLVVYDPDEMQHVYRLKEEYKKYADKLIQLVGYDIYDKITNEYVLWSLINKHKYSFMTFIGYVNANGNHFPIRTIAELFDSDFIGDVIVLERKSNDYKQYMSEEKDKKNKAKRECKKKKEAYLSTMLSDVENERKEKEKKENDVKIIKHGFDPKTSFRAAPAED